MNRKRLEKLRRRAYEARIRGNSKMDERQLLAALEQVGQTSTVRALLASFTGHRGATP